MVPDTNVVPAQASQKGLTGTGTKLPRAWLQADQRPLCWFFTISGEAKAEYEDFWNTRAVEEKAAQLLIL